MLPSQDKPDTYNCPSCGSIRECILDQIPSTASYILSFISIFLFGIWSLFIIPLIFQSTKVIVKRCYYCNIEIERQKFFAIPSLSDQVLQFKFGSCMIVLSRKYALTLLIIFIILFFYFELIREPAQVIVEDLHTSAPWLEFLELCGKFQVIDNGLRAKLHFEKQFHNKIVDWNGHFVDYKQNYDPRYPYSDWMFIKMEPTESIDEFPDLIIGIQRNQQQQIKPELLNIKQGQLIQFQARVDSLGNEMSYHMLELQNLRVEQKQKDLKDIQKYRKIELNMDQRNQMKKQIPKNEEQSVEKNEIPIKEENIHVDVINLENQESTSDKRESPIQIQEEDSLEEQDKNESKEETQVEQPSSTSLNLEDIQTIKIEQNPNEGNRILQTIKDQEYQEGRIFKQQKKRGDQLQLFV